MPPRHQSELLLSLSTSCSRLLALEARCSQLGTPSTVEHRAASEQDKRVTRTSPVTPRPVHGSHLPYDSRSRSRGMTNPRSPTLPTPPYTPSHLRCTPLHLRCTLDTPLHSLRRHTVGPRSHDTSHRAALILSPVDTRSLPRLLDNCNPLKYGTRWARLRVAGPVDQPSL